MPISKCVGIDLGTTNSVIAMMADDNKTIVCRTDKAGRKTFPSVIVYDRKTKGVRAGQIAFNRRGTVPEPIVSVKSHMGDANYRVSTGPLTLSPIEVSAEVLKEMKAQMESYLHGFPEYADYVVDNIYKDDAAFDYTQLIDMAFSMSYSLPRGSVLGLKFHYILMDVSTDFEGKSYDYRRNIPVFNRDFLLALDAYGRVPLTNHFAAIFESNFYKTGFLREKNTVRKESLGYGKAMLGAHFFWKDGLQNIILEVGGWKRTEERFYGGSLAQQFLVQLEYQGYFSFPFHRNFSE